ncbi:Endonuclease/exonuclease/phosphatase superfamily [Arabidopsis suecica]|uniref:Endonuclease/exonuclease/phosphatase superfamily n=1 Tax=Arabidopsis suecica TaxID=45249 RepID=A0A8T1XQG9_ARASU|nr:Endonuclease/exonuclease/phosphatase superfamily [Arabidopsis suecica]
MSTTEGSTDLSGTQEVGSWVSVVQNKQTLKKYDLNISTSEGQSSVEIPDEVFENVTPLWEDFLIGKFLDTAPHVAKVHVIVNKIWKQGFDAQKIDVYEVNSTTLRFRVSNPLIRARVLKRGMWNIAEVPMVVTKWTPNAEKEQQEEKSVPLWVFLKNVPMNMFSWEGLSFITSAAGHPVRLHPETAACSSFDVAKVFVNVDLSKELPKKIKFTKNGTEFWVDFVYPWLPPRCSICEKWGHLDSRCVANKKHSAVGSEMKWVEKSKVTKDAVVQTSTLEIVTTSDKVSEKAQETDQTSSEKKDDVGEWSQVSPSKTSRSPSKAVTETPFLFQHQNFLSSVLKRRRRENFKKQRKRRMMMMMRMVLRLGRIWILWRSTVRLTPVFKSDQLITCSVLMEGEEEEFFCSFIYAKNLAEERRSLWEDLRNHQDSQMFRNKRWMLMGDFNEILDIEEHSNFEHSPTIPQGMRDFQEAVRHCSLMDIGSHGPLFTWCNKQDEGVICKKLDRVLINSAMLNHYSQAYCVYEPGGCSDHLQSRIQIQREKVAKRKPFKFTNSIATMPEFLHLLHSYWQDTPTLFHSTSAMFRFSKKLKNLKPQLRNLSREKLGNLQKRVTVAFKDLCEKQKETLLRPTDIALKEETEAYYKWNHLAELEEKFLKQRSKLHWLDVGDQNNKVFHNAVKLRESKNSIREIQLPDGSTVSSQEEIKQEAERFFSEFLGHVPTEFEGLPADILEELIPFKCTNAHQCMLEKEVTAEEIRQVLFAIPANKLKPRDRMALLVNFSNQHGQLSVTISQLRFSRSSLKVISKILANRLKSLLPEIISPNQTAFIKNRLLMENVLLASEIVKDYHKDDVSPRCAMKIDISKAFDSVQWSFLLETLKAMHFPGKFIHWIQLCISTATFSVQVNGELAGFFGSKRGLRQGCALSPYLFLICMNVLSQRINKAAVEGKFGYHPRCHNVLLTHLCFADDLMVFAEGSKRSIEGIMSVFDDFAKCSGLKISIEKSTLYMAGIAPETQAEIQQSFPFATGQLPVRYLGLPLMTKAMSAQDYLPLTEKVRARISSWTSRFLSYAGRLQLIRSVLMSITNFWSATFCLPGACMKEIQQLCSAFLWSGPDLNTHKAKTSWETVCLPRSEGGLGLRPLKETNKVCGLKLIWRLLAAPTSMWSKWVHTYLIRKKSFGTVNANSSQGSWMWRKILKLRDLAKNFHRVEIKSGRGTSFWYDTWSSMGKLFDNFGDRGCIDLGISKAATVEEVLSTHKGRRRRVENLNKLFKTDLGDISKGITSKQIHIGVGSTHVAHFKRSGYPLALVGKHSKLGTDSVVAFQGEVHSEALRCVSTEADRISR